MAINFPSSPVDGNTYTYLNTHYTYKQEGANEGYWRVTLPVLSGRATSDEINAGVDNDKFISCLGLNTSKYVREDESSGETVLESNGTERLKASNAGVEVTGKLVLNSQEVVLYPIGSCYLTMASHNPATLFGGTWNLITGDASLSFGDGTAQDGVASGSNDPAVPLLLHSHTINHTHSQATTTTDTHKHNVLFESDAREQGVLPGATIMGGGQYQTIDSTGHTENDSHNHTLNVPSHSGNSGVAGASNVTQNVRGSRISVNVWERTA